MADGVPSQPQFTARNMVSLDQHRLSQRRLHLLQFRAPDIRALSCTKAEPTQEAGGDGAVWRVDCTAGFRRELCQQPQSTVNISSPMLKCHGRKNSWFAFGDRSLPAPPGEKSLNRVGTMIERLSRPLLADQWTRFPGHVADNFASWLPSQPYGALARMHLMTVCTTGHPLSSPSPITSQPGLIAYLNVGTEDYPFHPHGKTAW